MTNKITDIKFGDLLLQKRPSFYGNKTKNTIQTIQNYIPNKIIIERFAFLLFLEKKIIREKDQVHSTLYQFCCLQKGEKVYFNVWDDCFENDYFVLNLPKNINDPNGVEQIDLWLMKQLKIKGNFFYCKNKEIEINKGRYPKKEKKITVVESCFSNIDPFLGLFIKRDSLRRQFIFEFLYKNEFYWKEFELTNDYNNCNNFDNVFMRVC